VRRARQRRVNDSLDLLEGQHKLGQRSREQVVMQRMEGDGDGSVAGEMEGIRRLIGRVRFTDLRGRPVP
jgi:hypothetical protein